MLKSVRIVYAKTVASFSNSADMEYSAMTTDEIDLSTISRSFPFFDIARRTGEDYGAVLAWAGAVDRLQSTVDAGWRVPKLREATCAAVIKVCRAEWRWKFQS
jgi:hypothetical protein